MTHEKMEAFVKSHLDQVIKDGYHPQLIVLPEQRQKVVGCRLCGLKKDKLCVSVVGRGLDNRVYVYCIATTCKECLDSPKAQSAFLDRLEARYKSMNN